MEKLYLQALIGRIPPNFQGIEVIY